MSFARSCSNQAPIVSKIALVHCVRQPIGVIGTIKPQWRNEVKLFMYRRVHLSIAKAESTSLVRYKGGIVNAFIAETESNYIHRCNTLDCPTLNIRPPLFASFLKSCFATHKYRPCSCGISHLVASGVDGRANSRCRHSLGTWAYSTCRRIWSGSAGRLVVTAMASPSWRQACLFYKGWLSCTRKRLPSKIWILCWAVRLRLTLARFSRS